MILSTVSARAWDFDRESYEEDAGTNFILLFSPEHAIYGVGMGGGTWLRGTPVFGDYAARLYWNDIEKGLYSGVGMTLRIMPRWTFAPFAGGGGNYNHALTSEVDEPDPDFPKRGESYWSWHAEGGVRFWLHERRQFLDLAWRQTWSSMRGERDYTLIVASFGTGILPGR